MNFSQNLLKLFILSCEFKWSDFINDFQQFELLLKINSSEKTKFLEDPYFVKP